jgi:hypothetical protein
LKLDPESLENKEIMFVVDYLYSFWKEPPEFENYDFIYNFKEYKDPEFFYMNVMFLKACELKKVYCKEKV